MWITRATKMAGWSEETVSGLRLFDVLVAAPIAEHRHRNRYENNEERDDDNELNDSKHETEKNDQSLEKGERKKDCGRDCGAPKKCY
jgi:hypothetical protein